MADRVGVIYCVTNARNGKQYVGKTITTAHQRWKAHAGNAVSGVGPPLCAAIRKYGAQSFEVKILCAVPEAELNDAERAAIARLCTVAPAGYNVTQGGDGGAMPADVCQRMSTAASARATDEARNAVSQKLKTYYSTRARRAVLSANANAWMSVAGAKERLGAAIRAAHARESTKMKLADRSLLRSGWGHPWRVATLPAS